MKKYLKFILLLIIILFAINSCTNKNQKTPDRVVIGLESDVQTLNPLFVMNEAETNISELIFLSLVGHDWDNQKGSVTSYPVLAKSFEWSKNSNSVLINLKEDAKWSDGDNLTADDIVYSFDLYSDPVVQSRFFGIFKNYYTKPDQSIDLKKSFEVINPRQLKINFKTSGNPSTFDFDMPILPKHIFEKINRKELATSDFGFNPIGSGPYKLSSWEKNQNLKLTKNQNSILYDEKEIKEIVFKIIPDYTSRINQLKKGEIDITENIRPEDVAEITAENEINIVARKGREYDYLGFNNIDVESYAKNKKLLPHALFGNPTIRKAITLAINRQSILKEFLLGSGQLMVGPVAPIFKSVIDDSLKPAEYNIAEAKKLLLKEGWKDSNGDGIIEKNGRNFSFVLSVPSGNPLRTYTATVIQNNLKAVGIDVRLETLEPAALFEKMFKKELNAWIAGWGVPIPLDLKPYWYSKFEIANANVSSYINKDIDIILEKLDMKISEQEREKYLKTFQKIIFENQPVTFLFWVDNLVGYNKRIKNIQINPLGAVQKSWLWRF